MKRTLAYLFGLAGLVTVSVLGAINCGQPTIVSQKVGPEGAAITITEEMNRELAGVEILIPPGALGEPTVITIAQAAERTNAGTVGVAPAIAIGPEGLELARPVTLTLPTSRPVAGGDPIGLAMTELGRTVTLYGGQILASPSGGNLMPPAPDFGGEGASTTVHVTGPNDVSITFSHGATYQPVLVQP
jgi:hypothetical protein